MGDNCYANFNFTVLDTCPVRIGNNVYFGPNCTIATPVHPFRWQERTIKYKEDGTAYDDEYGKPVTIGANCWIASNVVITGGVTIGEGCVIGAGSGKKVWWLGKCGHEWQSTPNKRCKDNSQCPICYKERRSPSVVCVETGQIFKNGESAAKYVGLAKPSSIYRCCRGEQEKAKGYHWSYYSKE